MPYSLLKSSLSGVIVRGLALGQPYCVIHCTVEPHTNIGLQFHHGAAIRQCSCLQQQVGLTIVVVELCASNPIQEVRSETQS